MSDFWIVSPHSTSVLPVVRVEVQSSTVCLARPWHLRMLLRREVDCSWESLGSLVMISLMQPQSTILGDYLYSKLMEGRDLVENVKAILVCPFSPMLIGGIKNLSLLLVC